jgi:hypothetical protein
MRWSLNGGGARNAGDGCRGWLGSHCCIQLFAVHSFRERLLGALAIKERSDPSAFQKDNER